MIPEIEHNREAIAELCRRYHVRELSVFGSAVRGDFRPESDIDLIVEFEPDAKISLFDVVGLQQDFEGVLGRKVDLGEKHCIKRVIRDRVLAEAQLVFSR